MDPPLSCPKTELLLNWILVSIGRVGEAFVFFTITQSWQCWHYCQLCIPIHLQFSSLFATNDVNKCKITKSRDTWGLYFRLTCFIGVVDFEWQSEVGNVGILVLRRVLWKTLLVNEEKGANDYPRQYVTSRRWWTSLSLGKTRSWAWTCVM